MRVTFFRAALRGAVGRAVAIGLGILCATEAGAIEIRRDLGGLVDDRLRMVGELDRTGTEVRITGLCVSACTLLLGVRTACVMPEARLGFHGPTSRVAGVPLPRPEFDRVTEEMAAHYPPAIRAWYLAEARMVTGRYVTLTGAEAIRLGARPCRGG